MQHQGTWYQVRALDEWTREYYAPGPLSRIDEAKLFVSGGEIMAISDGVLIPLEQLGNRAVNFVRGLSAHPCLTEDAFKCVEIGSAFVRIRVASKITWVVAGPHVVHCLDLAFGFRASAKAQGTKFGRPIRLHPVRSLAGHPLMMTYIPVGREPKPVR